MIRYAHLQLPGGIKNLDNPDYELRPDSSAALHGTLMQVCARRGGSGGGGGGSSETGRSMRTRGASSASAAPAVPAAPLPAADAGGGGLTAQTGRLRAALDATPVDQAEVVQALEALKGLPIPKKEERNKKGPARDLRDLMNRIYIDDTLPGSVKEPAKELTDQWE